jgi:mono/diheme cytochrome c family protein
MASARGWAGLTLLACLWANAVQSQSGEPPVSAFAKAKAESLLRDHLPCLGCHKLDGQGGTIGPDLTTVRERRSAAYIAAMIADPQGTVPGSVMPRTEMPPATRDLISRYLASRPGSAIAEASIPRPPSRHPPRPVRKVVRCLSWRVGSWRRTECREPAGEAGGACVA